MTFTHLGEQCLNDWMARNAYVCWVEHPEPWVVEAELVRSLSLPLNIEHNTPHICWDAYSIEGGREAGGAVLADCG